MRNLYIFLGLGFLLSCSNSQEEKNTGKSVYSRYFDAQIDTLLLQDMGVLKHTTEGEEVEQVQLDSMTDERWRQELRGFVNAVYVDTGDTANYFYAVDESGKFQIRRLIAKDTLAPLQRWEEMRVNGAIQLITWETQKRSVLIDRRIEMTYQPLKGYRIRMQEDAAWARPRSYEVFAEFNKK